MTTTTEHRVRLVPHGDRHRGIFEGVCDCGTTSPEFTTAGMVWAWEDEHRARATAPVARNVRGEVLDDRCGDCWRPTHTALPGGNTEARCGTCRRAWVLQGRSYTGRGYCGSDSDPDRGADRHLSDRSWMDRQTTRRGGVHR